MTSGFETAVLRDYAVVGDTRAAALVSRDGSIDWLCLPRFDAAPVFGRLIDPDHGGHFRIGVASGRVAGRRYRPNTATLETTWESPAGSAVVTDAMIVDASSSLRPHVTLVREVECTGGRIEVDVEYVPRFGLPGRPGRSWTVDSALCAESGGTAIALTTSGRNFDGSCRLPLATGEHWSCVLAAAYKGPLVLVPPPVALDWRAEDEAWWGRWTAATSYRGPFREAVERSLITLRLLTFSPSGAVVASPTTSLPEAIGAGRNWDYRYAWPRDASLASGAFTAAGKLPEARAFLNWLLHTTRLTRPRIEVLYTLDGTRGHREVELEEVAGYRWSRPVRTGNAAATQHQLDVYGWIVDAAWHIHTAGEEIDRPTWGMVADYADYARQHWAEPDAGIWEVRGRHRHYTSSKLMAWLALDRARRMALDRGSDGRRAKAWGAAASELKAWVLENCVFGGEYLAQAAGDSNVDASVLLVGMTEMLDADSPVAARTVDEVRRRLHGHVPGLLYRYAAQTDGLEGDEGCFVPCSFWLAEALARSHRIDEAESVMRSALGYATETGLFGEELSPDGSEMLGNLPLAFSHAALVRAAFAIEAARA